MNALVQKVKNGTLMGAKVVGRKVKMHDAEITLGLGLVSMGAAIVFAAKDSIKAQEVLIEHAELRQAIEDATAAEIEEYTESDRKKDIVTLYTKTGTGLAKSYARTIIFSGMAVAFILTSNGLMRKRNIGLMAAYTALDSAFTAYRGRVAEEIGEEAEARVKKAITKQELTIVESDNDEGETKEINVLSENDLAKISPYAVEFNRHTSALWSNVPEYNIMFLKAQQNYATDMLRIKKVLFLNEVYDMLGLPRTQAGQVVGWVYGEGDNFVDFGFYEAYRQSIEDGEDRGIFEQSIVLDFNVDGIVYDKL